MQLSSEERMQKTRLLDDDEAYQVRLTYQLIVPRVRIMM